jgi:hypothetical protein
MSSALPPPPLSPGQSCRQLIERHLKAQGVSGVQMVEWDPGQWGPEQSGLPDELEFNLVFLDGTHDADWLEGLWTAFRPRVANGAVIVFNGLRCVRRRGMRACLLQCGSKPASA